VNISNTTGLVGFLLVLSTLSISASAEAAATPLNTIEARLSRLATTVRERAEQLPESTENPDLLAIGWADGRGGAWGNGGGGGFINSRPWRNGWADGGGFWNSRPAWRNGGSFVNRGGGGGFINRR
jgi:rSAM-associated Gly-rich repeat protein